MKAEIKNTNQVVYVREAGTITIKGVTQSLYQVDGKQEYYPAEALDFDVPQMVDCSISIPGWVARDVDGRLYFYENTPYCNRDGVYQIENGSYCELELLAKVTPLEHGDGPRKVELILKYINE